MARSGISSGADWPRRLGADFERADRAVLEALVAGFQR